MNPPHLGLLVCLQCLLCAHVYAVDRIIDTNVMEELQTKAVPDWQAAEREFRTVDVTYMRASKEGLQNQLKASPDQTFRFAYDSNRQVMLLRTQKAGVTGMNHDVANSRYDFEVSTPNVSARGTMKRLRVLSRTDDKKTPDVEVSNINFALCRLQAECRMNRMPLVKLLDPTEFEPVEAVAIDESGLRLIRFSGRFKGEEDRFRKKVRLYTVTLDSSHQYRSVEWRIDIPNVGVDLFKIAYHELDSIRIPRSIVYISESSKYRSEQEWTYELPQPWSIPDAEFYLPHYGFSESVLETLHPNPWPRWLLIGFGVLTIAIGAWLVRGRRQPMT